MKKAILINAYALNYASEALKNDKFLAFYAVLKEPDVYKFLSESLQNHITILGIIRKKKSEIAKKEILLFQNLKPDKRYENENFIYNAIEKDASFIRKINTNLQENRFFILDLVAKNSLVFKHLGCVYKNDAEIVKTSITPKLYATKKEKQKSASMIKFASNSLKTNESFIKQCLNANPYVKKYM